MSDHPYDDMTEPEMEAHLRDVSRAVDELTPDGTGFLVLLNPLLHPRAITQYLCNANDEDAIKWLRLVADRLEAGDVVDHVCFP